MSSLEKAVLCYVEKNFDDGVAYFTTQNIKEQWGDDWNDAPYEHNAGKPYDDHKFDAWKIIKIPFCVDGFEVAKSLKTTENGDIVVINYTNSPYSVEMINNKEIPWLHSCYASDKVSIFAGETIIEFVKKIKDFKGEVYFPCDWAYQLDSLLNSKKIDLSDF